MQNEILILITVVIDLLIIFTAARYRIRYLLSITFINLLLASVFRDKAIEVYGIVTNVGHVFYANVFLGMYLVVERKDAKYAKQVLISMFILLNVFMWLSFLGVSYLSLIPGDVVQEHLKNVFIVSSRVAIAGVLAYFFAQRVNIFLYTRIKEKVQDKFLWLQIVIAGSVSQLIDGSIFFTIAFLDLSGVEMLKAIFASWVIKTSIIFLAIPLVYVDRYLLNNKK